MVQARLGSSSNERVETNENTAEMDRFNVFVCAAVELYLH